MLGDSRSRFCAEEVISMDIMAILYLVLVLMNLLAVMLKIVLMIVQFMHSRNG